MTASQDDLRRWVQAGLVDTATADRILAFEAQRSTEQRAGSGRPGFVELLVYLAGAVTAAGFTVLIATNWEHLSSPSRIAIPAVSAGALFAIGHWFRRTDSESMVRGASLLWLLAGALTCATVAIGTSEAGWSERNVALAAGVCSAATSVAIWSLMPMHPQVVGIGAAAFLLSTGIGVRAPDDWIDGVLGTSLALCGFVVLIGVESGVLVPRVSARLVASATLAAGAFFAGLPPSPAVTELVALAVIVVLLTAGIRFESLIYVAFGVLTAFSAMLELILRHVKNPTVAGLALIAIGLLLLLAIVVLSRTRPWSRSTGLFAQTRPDADASAGNVVAPRS